MDTIARTIPTNALHLVTKLKLELCLLSLTLLCCGAAKAQTTTLGYVFFAPGANTTTGSAGSTIHSYGLGGGADVLFVPHFGIGGEIGAVAPGKGMASNTVGIFSVNPYVHFLRDKSIDPFATFGYSMVFRDFTANGYNFGGGTNYWFHENLGLLLEVRDHFAKIQGTDTRFLEIRIGLSFR